jgi:hypothetical protein
MKFWLIDDVCVQRLKGFLTQIQTDLTDPKTLPEELISPTTEILHDLDTALHETECVPGDYQYLGVALNGYAEAEKFDHQINRFLEKNPITLETALEHWKFGRTIRTTGEIIELASIGILKGQDRVE